MALGLFIFGLLFYGLALKAMGGKDRLTYKFTVGDEIIFTLFYLGSAFLLGAGIIVMFN